MLRFIPGAVVALLACGVSAAPIEIEFVDNARFLRCTDAFGHASCEVLLAEPENVSTCVAFDSSDEPIALTSPLPNGALLFQHLDYTTVATVRCRQ